MLVKGELVWVTGLGPESVIIEIGQTAISSSWG